MIRESIFFCPRETGFRFFFVIREICIFLRVIWVPTTFTGIILHFLEMFASLKFVNYIKLGEKLPIRRACGYGEPGRPRIYNQRRKSWDKFALLAFLRTLQTQIQLHLPNFAPQPPYNVGNYNLQFLLIFNSVLRGKGKSNVLQKECSAIFSNFRGSTAAE